MYYGGVYFNSIIISYREKNIEIHVRNHGYIRFIINIHIISANEEAKTRIL